MSKRRADRSLAAAAVLFAALGDETRLTLMQRLSQGPASISALADGIGMMTRQALTKHLQILAAAGVIDGRREGREHRWALRPAGLAEAQRCLGLVTRGWDDALARLKAHVEEG